MRSFTVEVEGTRLAGTRWDGRSAGAPTVVLLHSGVCDRRSWVPTAERLAATATVIAYDRRCYGGTPAGPGAWSDLDDLAAVLGHEVPGGGPVWLVGSSMGGLLALDAAITRPDRVAGLVLLAPAVSGAPEPDDETLDPATRALDAQLASARADGDLDRLNELHARLWLDGPAGPVGRVGGEARRLALAMNAVVLAGDDDEDAGVGSVDAWSRLGSVAVPVTVAAGDLDVPVLVEQAREVAARIPGATFVTLPGVAHLPYLERADLVADLVRDALR